MKKLLMALVLLPLMALADTEVVDGIEWTYQVNEGNVTIGVGNPVPPAIPQSTTGSVRIPSTLGGCPVVSIGDNAFYNCGGLTMVMIPSSVTSIGDGAFVFCSGLTSVTIPSSVTSIGYQAFLGCSELADANGFVIVRGVLYDYFGDATTVTIPSSVTSIGADVFGGCSELTSVTIPLGVTSIGDRAFCGCSGLTTVAIPSSMTNIDAFAFFGCNGLRQIRITGGDFDRMKRIIEEAIEESRLDLGAVLIIADTGVFEEIIVGKKVSIDTGLKGYKASGLPKGLVYDTKTGKITGTATKVTASEGVVIKFTKTGAEPEELTLVVRKEEMSAGCEGLETGVFPAGVVSAAAGIPLQLDTETGVKSVTVTKLPAGMKYDSKKGVITGTPTTAGDYKVVLSVTTKSGAKTSVTIPVSVEAMPLMASGTFSGFVSVGEDNFGTFTLTATSAGKLTAKVVTAKGTYSFLKTGWDSVSEGVYSATLKSSKGDVLTLTLDSTLGWDKNQLWGGLVTAEIAATKKTAAMPSYSYGVTAQRRAFGKTWYFAATGDVDNGWTLAYTENAKAAALTVTLKADGSTAIAGMLPGLLDAKGKALKVSASGYANVGAMKDGAILADFAPIVTVNKVKKALAIRTNLWFDRSNSHSEGVGQAKLVR